MRMEWTVDALTDLEHISTWIEKERTLALANRVCRRIYAAVQTLRQQPSLGRPGRVAGTRELVISGMPWIAVYTVNANAIQLLRILHGAQEWPPLT